MHDLDQGRRYATYADFEGLVKLHHTLPWLHHSGGVVCEPVDLPANKRHLDMLYAHRRHSDRAFMGAFIGAERAGYAIDMARILFPKRDIAQEPLLYCVSNTNAPPVMDAGMSGALAFGTPEAGLMVLAAGQLARRLGVPLHTVGTLSSSKVQDAQSQQEAAWGLMMAMFAGANVINHATGWLEGGLVTSFEKTMIDHDLCGKVGRFFDGIDLSENAQAMAAIATTGPGAHFLGSEHTQENFMSALFRPLTPDGNAFKHRQAAGSQDAGQRANTLWKEQLETYVDPGLDPDTDAERQDDIARRKAEQPHRDYF